MMTEGMKVAALVRTQRKRKREKARVGWPKDKREKRIPRRLGVEAENGGRKKEGRCKEH